MGVGEIMRDGSGSARAAKPSASRPVHGSPAALLAELSGATSTVLGRCGLRLKSTWMAD